MGTDGSITKFFFNLLPGAYFITLLVFFYFPISSFSFESNEPLLISGLFAIFSIFFGYVFQAFTIIVRHNGFEDRQFRRVISENPHIKSIWESLSFSCEDMLDVKKRKHFFNLLDCDLRGEKALFLPTHFSSLFALWANIFFASLLIFLSALSQQVRIDDQRIFAEIIVLVMIGFSMYLSEKFLYSNYDVIVNCYFMKHLSSKDLILKKMIA